jgi:hypothetical protein
LLVKEARDRLVVYYVAHRALRISQANLSVSDQAAVITTQSRNVKGMKQRREWRISFTSEEG